MLLAFDTATPAVTVALVDGQTVVASLTHVDALRHGELLAPSIRQLLSETWVRPEQLTAIAVGVGPGPFTGLRVGLVTARMLSAVLEIPAHGVCSLDILAGAGPSTGPFLVATDARRKEVFWARYADPVTRLEGPEVDWPDRVGSALPTLGQGPRLYPEAFPNALPPDLPDAAVLGRLVASGSVEPLPVVPLYLRRPDAAEPRNRKRVS